MTNDIEQLMGDLEDVAEHVLVLLEQVETLTREREAQERKLAAALRVNNTLDEDGRALERDLTEQTRINATLTETNIKLTALACERGRELEEAAVEEADIVNAVAEVGHGVKFGLVAPDMKQNAVDIARDAFRRARARRLLDGGEG